MEEELKDCPFCGNQVKNYPVVMVIQKRRILPDSHVVECTQCGATGGTGWSRAEAIRNWNRREILDLRFLD